MNDHRDDSRERDTDPMGLQPPPAFVGTPPESIDGAPPYMRTLFQKVDQTHKNTAHLLADMRMMRRQFSSFRDESRMRLRSLEEQVSDLETKAESSEMSVAQFSEELRDLRDQFDDLKRRVDMLLDDGR